jgi:hypothetical protein
MLGCTMNCAVDYTLCGNIELHADYRYLNHMLDYYVEIQVELLLGCRLDCTLGYTLDPQETQNRT